MRVHFAMLVMTDFKAFIGRHVFDIDDCGDGVTYVRGINKTNERLGSNGASKSSIFAALTWCLYGRTVDNLTQNDLITWNAKTKPQVEVLLWINDVEHMIKRKAVTNGLWLDGKVVSQSAIDKLLGLSFDIFQHTIILGQGRPLFFDLTAGPKMSVLSEALELDKWEDRSKAARDKAASYDRTASNAAIQLVGLEKDLDDTIANIRDLKNKSAEFEQERSTRDESRLNRVKALTKQLDVAEKEWGKYDLAFDGAETELRDVQRKLDDQRADTAKIGAEHVELRTSVRLLDEKVEELQADVKAVGKGDACPTCGQSLKGTALAKHVKEMRADIVHNQNQRDQQSELLQAVLVKQGKALKAIAQLEKQLDLFRTKSNDAIDARARAETKVAEIKATIKVLKSESAREEDMANPYDDLLAKARKQSKQGKQLIAECEQLVRVSERKRERARYWVEGFKNVRLQLLEEVLQELQAVTQTMLAQVGLADWVIEYAMERETQSGKISTGLNVSIFAPGVSKAVKFASWSGGEAQRLRLVGALALSETLLRRAGVECNMMILDEPTQHLSPEGVQDTIDVLVERGQDHQLFYVDHTAIENKRFANVVTVTKDETGAHIDVQ